MGDLFWRLQPSSQTVCTASFRVSLTPVASLTPTLLRHKGPRKKPLRVAPVAIFFCPRIVQMKDSMSVGTPRILPSYRRWGNKSWGPLRWADVPAERCQMLY